MPMSSKRKQAIYNAVHDRMTDLRIAIARKWPGNDIAQQVDAMLSRAADEAGIAAIEAATTGKHARSWRTQD